MSKNQNIYPMTTLVGGKKMKKEMDEYVSEAPSYSKKVDFLKGIDERFLNMGNALIDDDIYIQEKATQIKWDINSSKAQKFWMQSWNYRRILNYAIKGSLTGTAFSLSHIVGKLGLTFPTVTKIVNEGEAEGYLYVYNKGDKSEKTAIAAVEWLTIDYLKKYVPYRAEGWNAVLHAYDTDSFHQWYTLLKEDQKRFQKFAEQMNQAEEKYKK
jgi:hypothetical protein